jgi:hypothetical protein
MPPMRTNHLPILLAGLAIVSACARSGDTGAPAGSAPAELPWVSDDYPTALAAARERDLPLFVESWAPW